MWHESPCIVGKVAKKGCTQINVVKNVLVGFFLACVTFFHFAVLLKEALSSLFYFTVVLKRSFCDFGVSLTVALGL